MARTGMNTLISTLRGLTSTSQDDYTIGMYTYWADDDLQRVLDRHRTDLIYVEMSQEPETSGGTVLYKRFWAPLANLEQTTGGTAVFTVANAAGSVAGTALYSVDYARGLVTFAADQAGTLWYVTANAYDLNRAAAEVWRMKAAHIANTAINISTDNHSVSRGQLMKNYMDIALNYERQAGPATLRQERGDTVAY